MEVGAFLGLQGGLQGVLLDAELVLSTAHIHHILLEPLPFVHQHLVLHKLSLLGPVMLPLPAHRSPVVPRSHELLGVHNGWGLGELLLTVGARGECSLGCPWWFLGKEWRLLHLAFHVNYYTFKGEFKIYSPH